MFPPLFMIMNFSFVVKKITQSCVLNWPVFRCLVSISAVVVLVLLFIVVVFTIEPSAYNNVVHLPVHTFVTLHRCVATVCIIKHLG